MRPALLVALALTSTPVWADDRNPAVVIVPTAEEVNDTSDAEGPSTTYLVRESYPSTETETSIKRAMSERGWTLQSDPADVTEHILDNGTVLRVRTQAEGAVGFRYSPHSITQLWTDNESNTLRYTLDRLCTYETSGMHSVYVTVTATYRTREQRSAALARIQAAAQEMADRVRVTPKPSPTPFPSP